MSQHQTENKPVSIAQTLVPQVAGTWAIMEGRGLACSALENFTLWYFPAACITEIQTVSQLLG